MTGIPMRKAQQNSGNMLIYILGAIVLMGVLLMVLKGSFQEGVSIDAERAVIKVSEIQRYTATIERGVQTILRNGYSETDIRFAHPDADAGYGAISSDPARQVFSPSGGDVEYQTPPSGLQTSAMPWTFAGVSEIDGVGTTCNAARCLDLVAYLMNVSKEFCLSVNNAVGITNPSGNPPVEPNGFDWNVPFTGTFAIYGSPWGNTLATTGGYTYGKMEGCLEHAGSYHYYRVLLAR